MAQSTPADGDRTLQRRLVDGEAAALGESYDRFAPLVHGLAHRVLADDTAADRLTGEVFARLWAHPEHYDPAQGTLRSWLAGLTHRLAARQLREARGAALAQSAEDGDTAAGHAELERTVHEALVTVRADALMASMPAPLRAALELAYFQRRDCRQTAADLAITEAETHQRLRLGLQLMATARGTGPLNPRPDTEPRPPHWTHPPDTGAPDE